MNNIQYIHVNAIEDINLKEITLQDLVNRYKDREGRTYALRYNLKEHKVNIINVKIISKNKRSRLKHNIGDKHDREAENNYNSILRKYRYMDGSKKIFFDIFDKKEIIFLPNFILATNEENIIESFKESRKLDIIPKVFLYDWKEIKSQSLLQVNENIQDLLEKTSDKTSNQAANYKDIIHMITRNINHSLKIGMEIEVFVEPYPFNNHYFQHLEKEQLHYISGLKNEAKKKTLTKIFSIGNKILQINFDTVILTRALKDYLSSDKSQHKYYKDSTEEEEIQKYTNDLLSTLENNEKENMEIIKDLFSIYRKVTFERIHEAKT